MATSVVTTSITNATMDNSEIIVNGTLTFGAGDYTATGLTFDLTQGWPQGQNLPASQPPTNVTFFDASVSGTTEYLLVYNAGTTPANGKVQVFIEQTVATNTPLAEHTAATFNAALTGATFKFRATFPKLQ